LRRRPRVETLESIENIITCRLIVTTSDIVEKGAVIGERAGLNLFLEFAEVVED
jgi:predicted polyphosphate/ATP-dependent NAD kinase